PTGVGVVLASRSGRKPLLLLASAGMCTGLLIVAGAFFELQKVTSSEQATHGVASAGVLALIGLVIFIASFAFSLGPVVWTVINEVFPSHVRGRGVALATAINWGSAYLVSQFFLSLVQAIGSSMTFWLFALFCVIGWIWVYRAVPETKRQSLEQIQKLWSQ